MQRVSRMGLSKLKILMSLVLVLTACVSTANDAGKNPGRLSAESRKSAVGDYLKGRFAARQQQLDLAAAAYESAAYAAPTDAALLRYAFFYELAAGNVEKARPYAEKLLRPEFLEQEKTSEGTSRPRPSRSLPQLTLAADFMRKSQYKKALMVLEEESPSRFAQSINHLAKAWALYEVSGLDSALVFLDAPRKDLFTGFTPLHKGLMYDLAGETDNAEKFYQLALSGYSNQSAIFAYASFLERDNKKDEAKKFYTSLAQDNGVLRRAGRMGLIRLGAPLVGETKQTLRQARRRPARLVSNGREGAALALHNFAWASYEQAVSERAAASRAGFGNAKLVLNTPLAFAQLAVYLNDKLDAAHYVIGAIYGDYELYEAEIESLQKVNLAHPLYGYAITDMAAALEAQDKPEQAIKLLRGFVAADALSPDASLRLASLLSESSQYVEADQVLTQAINLAETMMSAQARQLSLWRYYFARGAMRLDADRWQAAETDLQRAVALSPEQPMVLNFLGYSWAERGKNLDEAFAMIEKALKLGPNSGAIIDSLGWAHYQLGHYREAVLQLERAVQLEPADPVVTDHLGDAYWQVGKRIQAKYEWRRVLLLAENNESLLAAARRKIAGGLVPAGAAAAQINGSNLVK